MVFSYILIASRLPANNLEAEGWQIEESPVHNAMAMCHPHPTTAFDDGGLWMSRGTVTPLSDMVDVMRRKLHAHLLAALPPQQLAHPAPVARVHQSWTAYWVLFSVLFSWPQHASSNVQSDPVRRCDRSRDLETSSLNHPGICSISPDKVHPRQLPLDLINVLAQILHILRQGRHFIELPPLISIDNHLLNEEFLLLEDDQALP